MLADAVNLADDFVAAGALVVVGLLSVVSAIAVAVIQGRKTRRLNTEEHEVNGARSERVLTHVLDLHTKVDHVVETVAYNGRCAEEVAQKVDDLSEDFRRHIAMPHLPPPPDLNEGA